MYAQTIVALTLMVAPVIQASLHQIIPRELGKRQGGDSFIPGTTPTDSCAPEDICAGNICLDRTRGDVCCKEGYGCPGGSFCLTQGYCCPDGDSVADCAAANGVTLPASFDTSALPSPTAASSTTSSTPAAPVSNTTLAIPETPSTTSIAVSTFASSTSVPVVTVSSSTLTHPPVGTGTGAVIPTTSMSLFTGAAARHADVGGGIALMLGLLGYVI